MAPNVICAKKISHVARAPGRKPHASFLVGPRVITLSCSPPAHRPPVFRLANRKIRTFWCSQQKVFLVSKLRSKSYLNKQSLFRNRRLACFIKNSENKRYITLVPLVCFAKCGCLTLLGQPQPHIYSYFHFTRNNWTKRENLSLKRSTQVSFYYQTLGPGALCSYWLDLQDSFRTCLMIRSSSLSKIAANHFHFRRFVWLPSNLSVFG